MAYIAILVATIIDIPTIITLLGSVITKSFWKVILLALIAASLAEIINIALRPTYGFMGIFIFRFTGQLIIGSLAYLLANKFRNWRLNRSTAKAKGGNV